MPTFSFQTAPAVLAVPPSPLVSMLPYHTLSTERVLGFGGSLDARSSSTRHRSTSELLRTL